jgi:SHS2 domain-containing protein
MKRFEEFEHTADVGIRAFGNTLEELFESAALGMCHLMAGDRELRPLVSRELTVTAVDVEQLLVRFLSELVYLTDVQRIIFSHFRISIDGSTLTADCQGEGIGSDRSGLGIEIKAVTYHMLKVNVEEGWIQVVFDV